VWYTGQYFALFFLQDKLQIDFRMSNIIVAVALLLGAPFFVVFGRLSDRIGRKKIMMCGCLLAILTYLPIYRLMTAASSPVNAVALTALVFVQVIYVTMVYGPIAAFLVEFFPTKIRYTSLSLPYHLGNGVFGGLTPLIGKIFMETTGSPYAGLYYPMAIAGMTFIIGSLFLPETRHISIWDEVRPETAGKPE
jgi:MFS family permease